MRLSPGIKDPIASHKSNMAINCSTSSYGVGNYLIGKHLGSEVVRHSRLHVYCGAHGIEHYGISAIDRDYVKREFEAAKRMESIGGLVARSCGISYTAWDCGLEAPTRDLTKLPAMNDFEVLAAFNVGWCSLNDNQAGIIAVGELGACNTTVAALIASQILSIPVVNIIGSGSGIDNQAIERKLWVANSAIERIGKRKIKGFELLMEFGGREIGALVGVLARCASDGIPVVLDGFVTCAAALFLVKELAINVDLLCPCKTQEPGQEVLANALGLNPFISLGHTSGDGVGASVGCSFIRGSKIFQDMILSKGCA